MGIQFTGLASGLDTQSIIADLMQVENMKVEAVEKEKTRVEWKKEEWSELNSTLYSFYKEELFSFKSQGTYNKKTLKNSDDSVISLNDSSSAVNGTHTITVNNMALGSHLNGSQLHASVDGSTTMADLVSLKGQSFNGSATINIKDSVSGDFDESNEITIESTDTLSEVLKKIDDLDLDININFDTSYNTLFMSSTNTGADVELSITDNDDDNSNAVLNALGFTIGDNTSERIIQGTAGEDASFNYNGVELTSTSNDISVNGLSFDINSDSGTSTVSVNTDTDAIYDSVASFITKYNEVLDIMNTKLDADSAYDYDVLSDDEKEAMTDDEIEDWENKIKDSLLRNDGTLKLIRNDVRNTLTYSYGVDTSEMNYNYLSDLGIVTGNYTEEGQLHIEGDEDDSLYSLKDNKLREAIENDAEGVMEFLSSIGTQLYSALNDRMKSTSLSSSLTFYNNKLMDEMINDYEEEIYDLEDTLESTEERYYAQFTAMEQAIQESNSTGDWLAQQLSAL